MAKLLTREEFAALTPGDHVWVEIYGCAHHTEEWTVGIVYYLHPELKGMWKKRNLRHIGHVFNFDTDRVHFWDGPPSLGEMALAPWDDADPQQEGHR